MMDCLGLRFHISPAFRGELTQIIGVTLAGPVPNADKTVPNQKGHCFVLGFAHWTMGRCHHSSEFEGSQLAGMQ